MEHDFSNFLYFPDSLGDFAYIKLRLGLRCHTHFIFPLPYSFRLPAHDRLAENQPTAGMSSLNEYEYENGMGKSETELILHQKVLSLNLYLYNNNHKVTEAFGEECLKAGV